MNSESKLVAIARSKQREVWLGSKPFEGFGVDIWRTSECTWLDRRGKPVRGDLKLVVHSTSPNMVESKSLKLFLMSLGMSRFSSKSEIQSHIENSLNTTTGASCEIKLNTRSTGFTFSESFIGDSHRLDYIPLEMDRFNVSSDHLLPRRSATRASGKYHTDCFRCLCPLTGQPDFATLVVSLSEAWLSAESLLSYLLSYRTHRGFHESTVERIFTDIKTVCDPRKLSVFASFARRGGIDIAVFRSTTDEVPPNWRSPMC